MQAVLEEAHGAVAGFGERLAGILGGCEEEESKPEREHPEGGEEGSLRPGAAVGGGGTGVCAVSEDCRSAASPGARCSWTLADGLACRLAISLGGGAV